MDGKKVLSIMVLGVFLAASAGFSQAGDRMKESGTPEFGTWEYWMAEETGNLPTSASGTQTGMESTTITSPESGTWEYWMAEETGNLPGSEPKSRSSQAVGSRVENAPVSGLDSWKYWIGG